MSQSPSVTSAIATTAEHAMTLPARAIEPVREDSRIQALDVSRGVALLGIIIVNIAYFAGPFGATTSYRPPADASVLNTIGWWIGKGLTEGNFYSMFATLFGVGLAIQFADAPRGMLAGRAARRLGFLLLLGFLHAMLVWYGDILFLYACLGTIAVLFVRASPRVLLVVGGCVLGVAILLLAATMGLEAAFGQPAAKLAELPTLDESKSPFFRLLEAWGASSATHDPSSATYLALETEAYAHGPYLDLFLFRAMTWGWFILFCLLGMGWTVLGMMLLGMGLVKSGFFQAQSWARQNWTAKVLLAPGMVLVIAGVVCMGIEEQAWLKSIGMVLRATGNAMVAIGLLGLIARICHAGHAGWLRTGLSRMGKMTLSNYLLQSLVCTTIFYFYGLGLFGSLSEIQRVGVALGVFVLGFTLSWFLAPRLAFGPVEWLWRSVTYWRVQPLVRRG